MEVIQKVLFKKRWDMISNDLEIRFEKDAETVTVLNEYVHNLHQEKHPDIFAPYNYEEFYPWYAKALEQDTF